jgi:hypothetical protein
VGKGKKGKFVTLLCGKVNKKKKKRKKGFFKGKRRE